MQTIIALKEDAEKSKDQFEGFEYIDDKLTQEQEMYGAAVYVESEGLSDIEDDDSIHALEVPR